MNGPMRIITVFCFAISGCAKASQELGDASTVSLSEAAGLRFGVVVVAHAFNCQLNGWVLDRLNQMYSDGGIPVSVVLIGHDSSDVEDMVGHMQLAMPHRVMDPVDYRELTSGLGVSAPFFALLGNGRVLSLFGNMNPERSLVSLKKHLQLLGYEETRK